MKRGRVIVLCVAAAIVILVVGIYALRPREPSYQGKSLSEWVDLLYTPNHTQAMNSIAAIGPKAIPFLSRKRGVGILLFKEFIGRFGRSFLQSCNSVFPLPNRWT